jgi:hypothetical protein
MEDKPDTKNLICPSKIGLMEETLRSLNENVLSMTSNEIKRETIKILGFNCSLSDFENIALDKTEKKVLKKNHEKAKQAVGSHFSRRSRAKIIFIDELEAIFTVLSKKVTVAIPFNNFDVKPAILANRLPQFIDHRINLIAQSISVNYEFMLENVVIFAVLDGLGFEEILESLIDKLQDEDKPVTVVNEEVFIDLTYKKAGHPTNLYQGETAITLRRWYPTSTSKAAISAFLTMKS